MGLLLSGNAEIWAGQSGAISKSKQIVRQKLRKLNANINKNSEILEAKIKVKSLNFVKTKDK